MPERSHRWLILAALLATATPARAGDPDPDEPLRPRYETPSEREQRARHPRFKKPSELPKKPPKPAPPEGTETPPPTADEPSGQRHRLPYHVPEMYSFTDGWMRNWNGEQFLVRPRAAPQFPQTMEQARADKGGKGVFYARGFYSLLSSGFREWSGVELLGYLDIADGFTGSLLFHHELREERAEMLRSSLSTRLYPNLHLITSLGAGNGAEFVPITSLDAELRGPYPDKDFLHWAVGAGTSWWAHDRREAKISLAGIAHVPHGISAEMRITGHVLTSPDDDARLYLRTQWTARHGTHGVRVFQMRFALGDAPEWAPGVADMSELSDRLYIDASWGFRNWVKRHYGYVINLNLGGQLQTFARAGLDISVFLEF